LKNASAQSRNQCERSMPDDMFHGAMPRAHPSGAAPDPKVVPVPLAEKCIGQVVLDWEFIHDLDLHLLKLHTQSQIQDASPEPSPEPSPEAANIDLSLLVDPATNELRLASNQRLQTMVSYRNKICNPGGGAVPQAVLELDRNAGVHSHEPVENLYLTEMLDVGVYVIAVHNYSQRQLLANVIGSSNDHTYTTFDEFKKSHPGYQMMENALKEQIDHADDEEGTPEKVAVMQRVEQQFNEGSRMLQQICGPGTRDCGVHYGVTIYTYPDRTAKHPQTASEEELDNLFKTDLFATSDCVLGAEDYSHMYNGANLMADTRSAEGRLALSSKQAAYLALLQVSKEGDTARIAEVKMLAGVPRDGGVEGRDTHGAAPMSAMRQQRRRMRKSSRLGQYPQPDTEPEAPQVQQQMQQMQQIDEPEMVQLQHDGAATTGGDAAGDA